LGRSADFAREEVAKSGEPQINPSSSVWAQAPPRPRAMANAATRILAALVIIVNGTSLGIRILWKRSIAVRNI
jgi:hypothetical protein